MRLDEGALACVEPHALQIAGGLDEVESALVAPKVVPNDRHVNAALCGGALGPFPFEGRDGGARVSEHRVAEVGRALTAHAVHGDGVRPAGALRRRAHNLRVGAHLALFGGVPLPRLAASRQRAVAHDGRAGRVGPRRPKAFADERKRCPPAVLASAAPGPSIERIVGGT